MRHRVGNHNFFPIIDNSSDSSSSSFKRDSPNKTMTPLSSSASSSWYRRRTNNISNISSKGNHSTIIGSFWSLCCRPALLGQLFCIAMTLSIFPIILYNFGTLENVEFQTSTTSASTLASPLTSMSAAKTPSSLLNFNPKLRPLDLLEQEKARTRQKLQQQKQEQEQEKQPEQQQPQTSVINKIIKKKKMNKPVRDDGCQLHSQVEPTWLPETPTRRALLEQVDACVSVISDDEPKYEGPTSSTQGTMVCDTTPPLNVIQQYRRVWFIGDSVHLQQYKVLNCLLMSSELNNHRYMRECGEETIYEHSLGQTNLIYSELGWNFHSSNHEAPLYESVFPQAVQTSTSQDAIVINLGLHYDSTRGDLLEKAARFVAQQSLKTNATIFYMETSDEQWPTTNGIWSPQCVVQTGTCEAVTPERQRGRGKWGSSVDLTMDIDRIEEPPHDVFGQMYPQLYNSSQQTPSFKVKTGVDDKRCIPDCLPANWRNTMVHPIFQDTPVTVVPIWNQLVSQKAAHARRNGDCIHKSLDALYLMNEQLLRQMHHTVTYGQRDGIEQGNPARPTTCGPETKLKVIVTGMEYTGMTYLSELIMSAPGYLGPYQTGFLLAETPEEFATIDPYYEWLSRTEPRNEFFSLSPEQLKELTSSTAQGSNKDAVPVDSVLHMYDYVIEHSPLFKGTNTTAFVDKTQAYIYNLKTIMKRAPSAKVVICVKTWKATRESWISKHGRTEKDFQDSYTRYMDSVKEAQEYFPDRIYIVEYNNLFGRYIKGDKAGASKTGRALFDWLGLPWKRSYLKGEAFRAKNRNCNLCSLNH